MPRKRSRNGSHPDEIRIYGCALIAASVLLFLIITTVNPTYASSPSVVMSSIPITITNMQNAPTPAPFQQMLVINSALYSGIATGWNNVEFTTAQNAGGTVLQAWVERNASNSSTQTLVWVRLASSIPAGRTAKIYMNILRSPAMSASGPTGEAPQLSSDYGAYDNGALVFGFYDNFKRTSLGSGWALSGNVSAYVSNSLRIDFVGNGYIATAAPFSSGTAFDTYVTADPEDNVGYFNTSSPVPGLGGPAWSGAMIREACGLTYPEQINASGGANGCGGVFGYLVNGESPVGVFSVVPFSSASSFEYINYSAGSSSQPITGYAPVYPASVGYAQMRSGPYTDAMVVQWARVRNSPPNGAMPSYALGSQQAGGGCNYAGKNLKNSNFDYWDLAGCTFKGTNLQYATFRGADVRRADFSGANLQSSSLQNADFASADLAGTNLQSANAIGADFSGADLSGANTNGCNGCP